MENCPTKEKKHANKPSSTKYICVFYYLPPSHFCCDALGLFNKYKKIFL